ncbi:nucleolar protein dao-5-like [Ornithodoros turicata]|uniref:nucleolar protein dao-5-like n=1 Tax=Ornithodoros turicata TaxID=34597 RepID=UPI003138D9C2
MDGQHEESNIRILNEGTPHHANRVSGRPSEVQLRNAPKKRTRQRRGRGSRTPRCLSYDQGAILSSGNSKELEELYISRVNNTEGTWVQCCNALCEKWRYLANVFDPTNVPEVWYCSMNDDSNRNSCDHPQEDISNTDFVETKYFVGSIVWAKLSGYPWWPAMIDDDPDSYLFYCNEDPRDEARVTHYHVTFLDTHVTRAWVDAGNVIPYNKGLTNTKIRKNVVPKYYKSSYQTARTNAQLALSLPLSERIQRFCFIKRYKGKLVNLKEKHKARRVGSTNTRAQDTARQPPPIPSENEGYNNQQRGRKRKQESQGKGSCRSNKNPAAAKLHQKQASNTGCTEQAATTQDTQLPPKTSGLTPSLALKEHPAQVSSTSQDGAPHGKVPTRKSPTSKISHNSSKCKRRPEEIVENRMGSSQHRTAGSRKKTERSSAKEGCKSTTAAVTTNGVPAAKQGPKSKAAGAAITSERPPAKPGRKPKATMALTTNPAAKRGRKAKATIAAITNLSPAISQSQTLEVTASKFQNGETDKLGATSSEVPVYNQQLRESANHSPDGGLHPQVDSQETRVKGDAGVSCQQRRQSEVSCATPAEPPPASGVTETTKITSSTQLVETSGVTQEPNYNAMNIFETEKSEIYSPIIAAPTEETAVVTKNQSHGMSHEEHLFSTTSDSATEIRISPLLECSRFVEEEESQVNVHKEAQREPEFQNESQKFPMPIGDTAHETSTDPSFNSAEGPPGNVAKTSHVQNEKRETACVVINVTSPATDQIGNTQTIPKPTKEILTMPLREPKPVLQKTLKAQRTEKVKGVTRTAAKKADNKAQSKPSFKIPVKMAAKEPPCVPAKTKPTFRKQKAASTSAIVVGTSTPEVSDSFVSSSIPGSEDSDFDSLSNSAEFTFTDSTHDTDRDFFSLEDIDSSQSFSFEE